jgi:hypothetical protein
MQSEKTSSSVSKGALWTGRILSVLPALFLLFDGAMKLVKPALSWRSPLNQASPRT